MKKTLALIIFLGVLYLSIYFNSIVLEYTYKNFNFWITVVINLLSMITFIYFIDKFVEKIDKYD